MQKTKDPSASPYRASLRMTGEPLSVILSGAQPPPVILSGAPAVVPRHPERSVAESKDP